MAVFKDLSQKDSIINRESASADNTVSDRTIGNIRTLGSNLTNRLSALRSSREGQLKTRLQPGLENNAINTATIQRAQTLEGSRASALRTGAGVNNALVDQELEVRELGSLLSTEQGVQQLSQQFTAIFNQMAQERFSQELSGLSEVTNKFLAKQGAQLGFDTLAANARKASLSMLGRFATSAALEFGRGSTPTDSGVRNQGGVSFSTGAGFE